MPSNNNNNTGGFYPADAYQANAAAESRSPFNDSYASPAAHRTIDMRSPGYLNSNSSNQGHAPQLSESFYAEAANALNGSGDGSRSPAPAYNSAAHAPSPYGAGPQMLNSIDEHPRSTSSLTAHLPTLLADAYGQPSSQGHSAGSYDDDANIIRSYSPAAGSGVDGDMTARGGADAGYTYYGGADSGAHDSVGNTYAGVYLNEPRGDGDEDPFSPGSKYEDEKEYPTPDPFSNAAAAGGYIPNPYLTPTHDGMDEDGTTVGDDPYGYGLQSKELYDMGGGSDGGMDGEGEPEGEGSGFLGGGPQRFDTQHFGPAPARGAQLRRHKTKKNVKLTAGNLVLDCPVPTKLQTFLTRRGEDEFMNMRYTAVTCDPNEFPENSFNLRPSLYHRHTEIFICVTMYNEDEIRE